MPGQTNSPANQPTNTSTQNVQAHVGFWNSIYTIIVYGFTIPMLFQQNWLLLVITLIMSTIIMFITYPFKRPPVELIRVTFIILVAALLGLSVGTVFPLRNYLPVLLQPQVVRFIVPEKAKLSPELPDIHIRSFEIHSPNRLVIEGDYTNIDTNKKSVWFYVYSSNKMYRLKTVADENNGIWTSQEIPIGDSFRTGGKYTLGVMLVDSGGCIDLQTDHDIPRLPDCVTEISQYTITR